MGLDLGALENAQQHRRPMRPTELWMLLLEPSREAVESPAGAVLDPKILGLTASHGNDLTARDAIEFDGGATPGEIA